MIITEDPELRTAAIEALKQQRLLTIEERFWTKVLKTETCWLWVGGQISPDGYGRFWDGKNQVLAHRWAYGPIPQGLTIDHLCRTRNCVRADHLEAVTSRENIQRGMVGFYNRAKKTCPKGHPYDYIAPGRGSRMCTICGHENRVRRRNANR